jgi:TIGR03009 family protein
MRPLGLTLPALLLAAAALAQTPGTPGSPSPKDAAPPAAPKMSEKNQKYLDRYLEAWQDRMAKIESLETKCILTEVEDGKKAVYTGDASLLKPNYAKLLLKPQAVPINPKKVKHIAADGKFLWEYDYSKKIAWVQQLPKEGFGDNMLMTFLYGLKAEDIKKRYDLSIDVEDKEKFNEHYLHIAILPKSKEDMQEFKKAELVLWVNNKDPKFADYWLLPARLWFQQPNGNQIIWEFQKMTTQKKLVAKDFEAPGFPDKEWRSDWSKPPAPTVTRTSAPPK